MKITGWAVPIGGGWMYLCVSCATCINGDETVHARDVDGAQPLCLAPNWDCDICADGQD